MGDKNRWGRWNKMNRGRETATGRQHWCSLTLTESIFWQASAFCNNLEIISVHKGPAVWQSKCSVPDQSLWFSQLLVSVCTCLTSISGPFSVIKVRMMELGRDWKGETKPQTEQKNINTDSETKRVLQDIEQRKPTLACYVAFLWSLSKRQIQLTADNPFRGASEGSSGRPSSFIEHTQLPTCTAHQTANYNSMFWRH